MHRRTRVLLTRTQDLSARTTREQFMRLATTGSQACRYRIGLAENAAQLAGANGVANASRIVAKQFCRNEHLLSGLRMHERGIVPDVVRMELDAPLQHAGSKGAASQRTGLQHAGVCFLRHFSLVQPYF